MSIKDLLEMIAAVLLNAPSSQHALDGLVEVAELANFARRDLFRNRYRRDSGHAARTEIVYDFAAELRQHLA